MFLYFYNTTFPFQGQYYVLFSKKKIPNEIFIFRLGFFNHPKMNATIIF